MSIAAPGELVCNAAFCGSEIYFAWAKTPTALRAEAASMGWSHEDERDFCPLCTRDRAEASALVGEPVGAAVAAAPVEAATAAAAPPKARKTSARPAAPVAPPTHVETADPADVVLYRDRKGRLCFAPTGAIPSGTAVDSVVRCEAERTIDGDGLHVAALPDRVYSPDRLKAAAHTRFRGWSIVKGGWGDKNPW